MDGGGTSKGWDRGGEPSTSRPVKQPTPAPRKAVPPGYLHDLLHSRHLMKMMGLRKQSESRDMNPNPLANVPIKAPRASHHGHQRASKASTPKLPELFQQRKLYLDRRKRTNIKQKSRVRGAEAARRAGGNSARTVNEANDAMNLLSLPEELLLKIVCYLTHEEAKPLFLVCKELSETLKNAIQFHFNFATPTAVAASKGEQIRGNNKVLMPLARRPQKKRAVTAYADVLGHLKRGGQRNVIDKEGPTSSMQSLAAPRALMFNTPQTTPTSLPQQLPALSGVSAEAAPTPRKKRPKKSR